MYGLRNVLWYGDNTLPNCPRIYCRQCGAMLTIMFGTIIVNILLYTVRPFPSNTHNAPAYHSSLMTVIKTCESSDIVEPGVYSINKILRFCQWGHWGQNPRTLLWIKSKTFLKRTKEIDTACFNAMTFLLRPQSINDGCALMAHADMSILCHCAEDCFKYDILGDVLPPPFKGKYFTHVIWFGTCGKNYLMPWERLYPHRYD